MSDDPKPKDKPTYEYPMMPFYGLDLGRELGSIDSRLTRVENDILELRRDVKAVDARVDKCLVAINRLDERTQSQGRALWGFGFAILAAVIAGVLLQLFK